MERIFAFLEREDVPAVLATLIFVKGHAYRKEGAVMLLAGDGRTIGSISPGCLEADLLERVPRILREGRHETVDYNLRPETDPVWGEAIGCGGELRILLEPVAGELRERLKEIGRSVRAGEPMLLVRRLTGGRLRYAAVRAPLGQARRRRPFSRFAGATLFAPPERLILFGAGEEAEAIGRLAGRVGFRIAVADWREGLCSRERFPYADTAVGDPDSIIRQLAIGRSDYVIVGSHHLRRDRDMLVRLLPLRPAYVGLIGSRRRIGLLLDGLPSAPFVKGPAGTPIGSEGADEIAVSVAAELIAWRKEMKRRGEAWESWESHDPVLIFKGTSIR